MAPISSPVTEAYEQISRGVIQGMFQQKETVIAFKMTQHMPTASFVLGGFAHSSQFMIVNEAKWKALESRDREAIEKLSGETMVRRFAAVWQAKGRAMTVFSSMICALSGSKAQPVIASANPAITSSCTVSSSDFRRDSRGRSTRWWPAPIRTVSRSFGFGVWVCARSSTLR